MLWRKAYGFFGPSRLVLQSQPQCNPQWEAPWNYTEEASRDSASAQYYAQYVQSGSVGLGSWQIPIPGIQDRLDQGLGRYRSRGSRIGGIEGITGRGGPDPNDPQSGHRVYKTEDTPPGIVVFSYHQAIASFKRSPLGYHNTSITSIIIYFSYIPEVVI